GRPTGRPFHSGPADQDLAADGDEAEAEEGAERAGVTWRDGGEEQLALRHEAQSFGDEGAAPAAIGFGGLDTDFAAATQTVGERNEAALVAIDGDVLAHVAGIADAVVVIGIGADREGRAARAGTAGDQHHIDDADEAR